MDVLYSFLSHSSSLSSFNAVLLLMVFYFAKTRWQEIVEQVESTCKKIREHEMTFAKQGIEIYREEE